MGNTTDLRILKTRMAIKNAFLELMDEKAFEKITISDITQKAMINRGTFYSHYKDKPDLVDQIENEILDEVSASISFVTEDTVARAYKENLPLPHLIPVLSYIEEHPRFFVLAAENSGGTHLLEKISDKYFRKLAHILKCPNDKWISYRKTVAVSVISSILNQWINGGMKEPKEELAAWLTRLMFANMESVINPA